jgi:hypothetical protein
MGVRFRLNPLICFSQICWLLDRRSLRKQLRLLKRFGSAPFPRKLRRFCGNSFTIDFRQKSIWLEDVLFLRIMSRPIAVFLFCCCCVSVYVFLAVFLGFAYAVAFGFRGRLMFVCSILWLSFLAVLC